MDAGSGLHPRAMNKASRSQYQDRRRVFRVKRRFPTGMVVRQLMVVLLMLVGAAGIGVMLWQLPERIDVVLLVSEAIADLIRGVQQLLEAMLGLAAVVLIGALVMLAVVMLLGGLWRLIRLLRLLLFPSAQGRR